jgi:hypothetical protein
MMDCVIGHISQLIIDLYLRFILGPPMGQIIGKSLTASGLIYGGKVTPSLYSSAIKSIYGIFNAVNVTSCSVCVTNKDNGPFLCY